MTRCRPVVALLFVAAFAPGAAHGEVLVRWDQSRVPAAQSLGVAALVIPSGSESAVQDALAKGFRVYLEVERAPFPELKAGAEALAGVVVRGSVSGEDLQRLRTRLPPAARVLVVEERGTWPHVRLGSVTLRQGVLRVSRPSEQPWIESNGALVRLAARAQDGVSPVLAYSWAPIASSGAQEEPGVDDYLVAIAEAGLFGHDLVLPLHEGFQRALLAGRPDTRAAWEAIRRALDFYAWDLPKHYEPVAEIGVMTGDPDGWFEVLNLLTRHNLPFQLLAPGDLAGRALDDLSVLIVLDASEAPPIGPLTAFARNGGTVVVDAGLGGLHWKGATVLEESDVHVGYRLGEGRVLERREAIGDPDRFALEVRDLLGPARRVYDIWNGLTVVAAPYRDPAGDTLLLAVLDYAHETRSIQVRVRGTFAQVHFETPESRPVLLPYRHRDGHTEFVLPDLRIGGRVFLTGSTEPPPP